MAKVTDILNYFPDFPLALAMFLNKVFGNYNQKM